MRLAPQPVDVTGGSGTAELRVQDPGRPGGPGLIVTLVRAVPREPRDVCFGTYTTNENPEDGDVGCQVRGREPLVLTLASQWIPRSSPTHRFTAVYGQAKPGIRQVELMGAVFDYEVGENIITKTYRQIIRRFGPPLRGFTKRQPTRCAYYDMVGYQDGWTFCFQGQRIIGAAGNQPAPPGVH